MTPPSPPPAFDHVMWVRVEKPIFDLVGVLVSSFGITGICVGVAITLGACWGAVLIRRGRSRRRFEPEITLDLQVPAR